MTILSTTFTKSIIDNKQNLNPVEINTVKTFLATSFDISTSISSIISKYETNTITYVSILELIISLTNIVKNNSLLNQITGKQSVFLMIQFILFTLIDYNLIPVPDTLKHDIEEFIEHSLNILDTNLETIENVISKTESSCKEYCKKNVCGCM